MSEKLCPHCGSAAHPRARQCSCCLYRWPARPSPWWLPAAALLLAVLAVGLWDSERRRTPPPPPSPRPALVPTDATAHPLVEPVPATGPVVTPGLFISEKWDATPDAMGWVTLSTTVTNRSGRAFDYVEFRANVKDKQGAVIENLMDNMTHLPPGGVWRMKLLVTEAKRFGEMDADSIRLIGR